MFVTDRGRPTHVLLGIEAFRRLAGQNDSLGDRLAMADPVDDEPDWRTIAHWPGPASEPR